MRRSPLEYSNLTFPSGFRQNYPEAYFLFCRLEKDVMREHLQRTKTCLAAEILSAYCLIRLKKNHFAACLLNKVVFNVSERRICLSYALPKQRLGLPLVVAELCGFAVAACCAALVADVICSPAAASAHDVDDFTLTLTL